MFGYWAAIWGHLHRLGECNRPNPWKSLVKEANAYRSGQVRFFVVRESPPNKAMNNGAPHNGGSKLHSVE